MAIRKRLLPSSSGTSLRLCIALSMMPRKRAEHCNAECCRAWIPSVSLSHGALTEMQNLQPYGDQQRSAESRKEKTDHIRASCELPKEHTCNLEKTYYLNAWKLELVLKTLSAFQIWPLDTIPMILPEEPEGAKCLAFLSNFCISSKVKPWRNNVTVLWFLNIHTLTMLGSLCGWTVNFTPDEIFPYS